MKRLLVVLVVAGVVGVVAVRVTALSRAAQGTGFQVALVYDPASLRAKPEIRAAYDSVLREEGISHRWIDATDLALLDGAALARRYPAMIFPDGVARRLPDAVAPLARDYVRAGGDVAVVFDAGSRDRAGRYRSDGGLFAALVGVPYERYPHLGRRAYVHDSVRFRDSRAAARWNLPPGKLFAGKVVGGYAYGSYTYPLANAGPAAPGVHVAAVARRVPALAERRVGRGRAFWVDLPLGYLKGHSDDLPLRAVMRTILLGTAHLPHLVPAPDGVAGLVVSWHVDSAVEWRGVPEMLRSGLVRPGLPEEFDITAGPFRDHPGDGLGFDACGRGRPLVRLLAGYGAIGSHGGWAHNWFALRLEHGSLSEAAMAALIRRNDACLERITGRAVRSYAAPQGVFPQPVSTQVLERLGIDAYYYTGDTGSPPNRTFFGGRMVSPRVWAFPVMPNGRYASIGEMIAAHVTPAQVGAWLDRTLAYTVGQREVRLVYSHPYDLLHRPYRRAFLAFLDRVQAARRAGRLTVGSMHRYAAFMARFVRTRASFVREGSDLVVRLENPAGLRGIAFAVPAGLAGGRTRVVTVRRRVDRATFRIALG